MNPGPRNPNSSSAEMAEGVGATVSLAILVGLALGEALGDVLGAVLGNVLGEAVGLKQKITSKPGKYRLELSRVRALFGQQLADGG